jgi:two-component system, OmpR family, phosphate regulon sensor histidine kinase PhoR
MSKKLIIVLFIFMSVALLGLILVQSFWINNAFKVKEKHFDQMVQKALVEAVYTIQRNETMNFIYDKFEPQEYDTSFVTPKGSFNFDTVINFEFDKGNGNYISQNLKISHSSSGGNTKTDISVSANHGSKSNNDLKYNESFLKRVSNRKNFIDQVISQMFRITPDIEKRLTPEIVEKTLKKSLIDNGIDIDFEYAVKRDDKSIVFNSGDFEIKENHHNYELGLFPDDFFNTSNSLSIYFPYRRNFIIHSLGLMGVSSAFLTLFLILTFAFTLFVIIRQKKLSEMKSDFVNNMTHELKTPISTISLASQMLSDKSIPVGSKNTDRISEIIAQESKRLGYQVERVLQMAKFDQGKLNLKFRETNLHDLIESVISNFILQVDSKEGMLIPSLHADNDLINADPVHMTNVISNLLDNAIKYTTRKPEIIIETQSNRKEIILIVRDNGIGINKTNQKRIFDKFYRVPTGNVHNIKGFGLGLSYVKKIIEEHSGNVKVESEPGIGSSFILKIPLKNE